jgi:hypothetical protein
MPEGLEGMESWLKLRQRLQLLNERYDKLNPKVTEMLEKQILNDADVEVNAMVNYQQIKNRIRNKMAKTANDQDGDASTGIIGTGGASSSPSSTKNNSKNVLLTKTPADDGPVPFAMKTSSAMMNCFDLQQLVIPITRLCEFEIIPWCLMDIYVAVLFPTWADLGFVSMFSKTPPLIDLQDFASLLAVHRLVLHRREDQILAVKRIPVTTTQPNTPWMPIVQRRVLRQTVLVAQAAKKGRLGQMMRVNSSMNLGSSLGASSFVLSQSSLGTGVAHHHHGSASESALRERTNSLHSNMAAGVGDQQQQAQKLQRSASVHSTGNVSSNSQNQGHDQQQQQHAHGKSNQHQHQHQHQQGAANKSGTTPPQSSTAISGNQTPQSTYSSYLNLDDTTGTLIPGVPGIIETGTGGNDGNYDDELLDDDNDDFIEKSALLARQVEDIQFRARPFPEPPQHLVGVAPRWPEETPTSWISKWQQKMERVPTRCTHTEFSDPDKPLSYQKLPLYDEYDDPLYEGPAKITEEYARRLEIAGPLPFAVRKIERSLGSDVPRFDTNLRPSSAKQWLKRDPVDGSSIVDRGGLRPMKPRTTLRSGLYWFAASPEQVKKTADEEEMERIEKERLLLLEKNKLAQSQGEESNSQQSDQVEAFFGSNTPRHKNNNNNSRPGTASTTERRKPFCAMTRSHVPSHPPYASNICPLSTS